jgi:large subunit ribosomal protein L22
MKAQSIAYQKFIHETPRKLRLIADAIRGQKVENALIQLKFSTKHAAVTMQKILTQAKSNALNVHSTPQESLIVKAIVVEEGPRIKRWRPVSRGMAHSIIKRTSHVKIVVEGEKAELVKKTTKKEGK